jgi:NAD(P)H-flavin reductase
VQIKVAVEDVDIIRCYTPVLESLEPFLIDDGSLHLLVKTYEKGMLTPEIKRMRISGSNQVQSAIISILHVSQCTYAGETLLVSDHLGSFFPTINLDSVSQLILLAAGTGFSPMAKLIQTFLALPRHLAPPQQWADSSVMLLFFNQTRADVIWREELERIKGKHPIFTCHHIFSQEMQQDWSGPTGRISEELLRQLLCPEEEDKEFQQVPISGRLVCVCGPTPFMNLARE